MRQERIDKIPLSQAAEIAGRSVKTVRRWVKKGKLTDQRREGDELSPVLISEGELRKFLGSIGVYPGGIPKRNAEKGTIDGLRAQIRLLEQMNEEIRGDKRRLIDEVERLKRVSGRQ